MPIVAAAASLDAPGPVFAAEEEDNAAAWRPLFDALANKGAVFATFTERRWLAVRREPVELEGEMRFSPDHGLSLRYPKPRERILVIDAQGMLLRDERGRAREMRPNDRGTPAANALLLPVLRFDLPRLREIFVIHGARDGEAWRLDFVPRDNAAGPAAGGIVVQGEGETVRHIELRPAANQRIGIAITGAQTGVQFSADDVKHFFR